MWSLPNGNDVISDVIDINAQGAGRLNDSYKCLATNEQGSEMLVMTLGEILTPQPGDCLMCDVIINDVINCSDAIIDDGNNCWSCDWSLTSSRSHHRPCLHLYLKTIKI